MKYRLWVWSKSKGQFTHRELPLGFIRDRLVRLTSLPYR